jgi:hypothetical protein
LLEGGERGKDGSSDPDRVFTLRRSNDFNFHGRWSKSSNFLLHPVRNTRVHCGTTGLYLVKNRKREYHDNVTIKILADIDVTLHDGVICGFVDTGGFLTEDGGLEQSFGGTETFVTDGDDLTVWKFVGLFETRALSGSLNFLLEIEGNIAQLLLNVTDDFSFGGCAETVTTLSEDLHEVIGKITSSKIEAEDSMRQSITWN